MIIDNFYTLYIIANPLKTNSPLIINANAILTRTISNQFLKSIYREGQANLASLLPHQDRVIYGEQSFKYLMEIFLKLYH